jgi:hypothetical protein
MVGPDSRLDFQVQDCIRNSNKKIRCGGITHIYCARSVLYPSVWAVEMVNTRAMYYRAIQAILCPEANSVRRKAMTTRL